MSVLSNLLNTVLQGASTTIAAMTPQQRRQLANGINQTSTVVTQAVESQELDLLDQIGSDPANASAALAQLTGISSVPRGAVGLARDAVSAFKAGDKTTFATNMSNAKALVLQQKIGPGTSGIFGGLFG